MGEKSLCCPVCGSARFRIVTQQTVSCDLGIGEVLHAQDEEVNTLAGLRCDECEAEIEDAAIVEAVHALFMEAAG